MSLLCGCVGKKGTRSPKHTTIDKNMRRSSGAPSTGSRFGFGAKSSKQNTPVVNNNAPAPLELKAVTGNTSNSSPSHSDHGLAGGLALDPSALLLGRRNDSLGGYVKRDSLPSKPRPTSSIASLGKSKNFHEQDSGFSSFDETASNKPKTGLRSLFSRSFNKEKPAPIAKPSNGPKNDIGNGGMSRLKPRGSVDSTASSCSNHSTDSRNRNSYNRSSSPIPRNVSPTPTGRASPSKGNRMSLQSKLATVCKPPAKTTSLPKITSGSGLPSAQNKPKHSRLSYPASKQSQEDQCKHSQERNDARRWSNNNVHTTAPDQCKRFSIDPVCLNSIANASAPVASEDTDSETSFSTVTPEPSSSRQRPTKSSISIASASTTGSASGDKRKPTIEINPLTKETDTSADSCEVQQSDMGVNEKAISKPSTKTYTIDEELFSSILAEMASLKSTVVELQHHLIGKQEHEDKLREEIAIKSEIINSLQHEMSHCTCRQSKGYGKIGEAEMLAASQ